MKAVYITNGKDGFNISATKDNGYEVHSVIENDKLKWLENFVESILSEDEAEVERQRKLLEEAFEGKSDKEKLEKFYLFPEWNPYKLLNRRLKKGEEFRHLGKLYKVKKEHMADNQLSPLLELELWEEVKDPTAPKPQSEYEKALAKAKPWQRDESYKTVGTYVTWYGNLYKLKEASTDGEEPGKGSNWEKIERK